jgi:hypothetical protein
VQSLDPSFIVLHIRSARNQHSNSGPMIAVPIDAECRCRFSQLCVFFNCPFTSVDVGVQSLGPSSTSLHVRSTRNQHSNCNPIIAEPINAVLLYRISQLCIFFRRGPNISATCHRTVYSFDPEPAQQLRPNSFRVPLPHQSALRLLPLSI